MFRNNKLFSRNKPLIITFLTVIIPTLLQLFYVRYVSYEVDPNIFGDFVLLITLASAVSAIFLTIPATAFTRYFNESSSKARHINEFRSLMLPVNIASFIAIIIYSFLMPEFDFYTLGLIYIYILLQNNTSLNRQIILQSLERKKYFFVTLVEKSSRFVLPILFFYFYKSLNSLVEGLIIGSVTLSILLAFYNKKYKFELIFHMERLKEYFFYAYPIIFTSIFSWIIVFSDRYFINYYLDSTSVGIYALLAQVAAFTSLLNSIFSMYVNPIIYKLYSKDKKTAIKRLTSYIWVLLGVIILMLIIVLFIPKDYLLIILSPEVIEGNYTTLLILVAGSIFSVIQNSLSLFFTLSKSLHVLGYFWLFASILNLFGNTMIQDYGIIAAAVSTCLAYLFVVIANLVWIVLNSKKIRYLD